VGIILRRQIIGKIMVGTGVNIGANAVVLKDVPHNGVVVSPAAYLLEKETPARGMTGAIMET
jgi:serine acetyltransferase